MHLRYYLNEEGKRVYTLKTVLEDGQYTFNAHPGTESCVTFSSLQPRRPEPEVPLRIEEKVWAVADLATRAPILINYRPKSEYIVISCLGVSSVSCSPRPRTSGVLEPTYFYQRLGITQE
jgi:hypothetical protein